MKKVLALYKAPTSAFEQAKNAPPAEQKAGMDAWMAWSGKSVERWSTWAHHSERAPLLSGHLIDNTFTLAAPLLW